MSTRSTVHFVNESWDQDFVVYVHQDGYPSCRGKQVLDFLRVCKEELKDPRLGEAGVTAARFVAYMIDQYHQDTKQYVNEWMDTHPLAAISVKMAHGDPGDIEFRYDVDCDNLDDEGYPSVTVEDIYAGTVRPLTEVMEELESE